jgi:parallel beta-helix repeat protein
VINLKSKKKQNIVRVLFLLVLFFVGNYYLANPINNKVNREINGYTLTNVDILRTSGHWNLSPFVIDDSATGVGAHNWTWAETQPWCSGSGTLEEPYLIENVTIDGGFSVSCITIKNSDKYFEIKNCTFYNAGPLMPNAGIKLNTTQNGKLLDNNCTKNIHGITLLDNCRNILISGNILNENFLSGIFFQNNCSYNIIENNEINAGSISTFYGIYFYQNNSYNVINMNNVTNNGRGIRLWDNEDSNIITNNNISNSRYQGLEIRTDSDKTKILNNIIHENGHTDSDPGIYIDDLCEDTIISNNSIYHNGEDGIYVKGFCHRTLISNNTISDNLGHGIAFTVHNKNVTISNNLINDNDDHGIHFGGFEAENVKILNNNVSNNLGHGIHISHDCDDAQVIGNNVINNLEDGINLRDTERGLVFDNYVYLSGVYGIRLYQVCDNSNVTENIIKKSGNDGIFITESENCTVNFNMAFENQNGIGISTSDNTNITNNVVKYNSLTGIAIAVITNVFLEQNIIEGHSNYGLRIGSCTSSRFSENMIINSFEGIEIDSNSDNNNFTNNYIKDCNNYGVIIGGGNDFNLFYENYFVFNQINHWNNSYVGNFWSDYIGVDLDQDGIGDIPHDINGLSNAKDFLPIYNNLPSIYIDEYTKYNWQWVSQFYWCNGSGTAEDPYIIENKIIDFIWPSNRIEIRNSNKYFIIENCTLSNNRFGYSGILLHNTMNGKIIDCNSEYNEIGIKLESCNNINVSGNDASNNLRGISLANSDDSDILGNIINQNGIGLELWQSNYNFIKDNTLHNNEICILEIDCIGNTFENNDCGPKPLEDLFITIIDQKYSSNGFNQNLGGGKYFVSLEPITVDAGDAPILLHMIISATGYLDKYFDTYLSVRPCDLIDLLYIGIVDQIYTEDYFNITFYITNATGYGIDSAIIQMWWDGTDVSSNIVNLGSGFYKISLTPILVSPGEDPILLEITVTSSGYQDLNCQIDIAIDPESVTKGEIVPFPIIIPIIIGISIAGGALGAAAIYIFLRKRKLGKGVVGEETINP